MSAIQDMKRILGGIGVQRGHHVQISAIRCHEVVERSVLLFSSPLVKRNKIAGLGITTYAAQHIECGGMLIRFDVQDHVSLELRPSKRIVRGSLEKAVPQSSALAGGRFLWLAQVEGGDAVPANVGGFLPRPVRRVAPGREGQTSCSGRVFVSIPSRDFDSAQPVAPRCAVATAGVWLLAACVIRKRPPNHICKHFVKFRTKPSGE